MPEDEKKLEEHLDYFKKEDYDQFLIFATKFDKEADDYVITVGNNITADIDGAERMGGIVLFFIDMIFEQHGPDYVEKLAKDFRAKTTKGIVN